MNTLVTSSNTLLKQEGLTDSAGMIASIACAIHCAAMPFVISYLPLLGLSWLADESFHKVMAIVCFALAGLAFAPGWRKHRSFIPIGFGAAGILLLTSAAFGLEEGCCPTCVAANESNQASEEAVVNSEVVLTTPAEEGLCTDPTCTFCESDSTTSMSEVRAANEVTSAEPTLASSFIPFMTPLGGVLLVIGHVVNHRKSCQCQGDHCCHDPSGQEAL